MLGESLYGFGLVFSLKDQLSNKLQSVAGSFNLVEKRAISAKTALKVFAAGAGIAAAGGGLLMFGKKLADKAEDYNRTMNSVRALAGLTNKEMMAIEKQAMKLGVETMWSPEQAAKGYEMLALAGKNYIDQMKMIPHVLDFAAASQGKIGVQQATDAVLSLMEGYGLAADQTQQVVDMMTQMSTMTGVPFEGWKDALKYIAAPAKAANQELSSLMAVMGALSKTKMEMSMVGTAARTAYSRIYGKDVRNMLMKTLGVAAIDPMTGMKRQLQDIIFDMEARFKGLGITTGKQTDIIISAFGQESQSVYHAITGIKQEAMIAGKSISLTGRDALEYLKNASEQAKERTRSVAAFYRDSWKGAKDFLAGTIGTISIWYGKEMIKMFKPMLYYITNIANKFLEWSQANPGMAKLVAKVTVLGGGILVLAGSTIMAAGAFGLLFTAALPMLPILGTIALAMGTIVIAAYVAYKAWKNWDTLKDIFKGWYKVITEPFVTAIEFIQAKWHGMLAWIGRQGAMLQTYNPLLAKAFGLGGVDFAGLYARHAMLQKTKSQVLREQELGNIYKQFGAGALSAAASPAEERNFYSELLRNRTAQMAPEGRAPTMPQYLKAAEMEAAAQPMQVGTVNINVQNMPSAEELNKHLNELQGIGNTRQTNTNFSNLGVVAP